MLYVHGWSDYFFQKRLARFWTSRGARFFALDLRKYGRSLHEGQTPGYITDLATYDEDISAEFDHGLLSIRVPKRSRPEPRRIRVDSAVKESARTTGGERSNRLSGGSERPGQYGQGDEQNAGRDVQGGGSSASRSRTGRAVTSDAGR